MLILPEVFTACLPFGLSAGPLVWAAICTARREMVTVSVFVFLIAWSAVWLAVAVDADWSVLTCGLPWAGFTVTLLGEICASAIGRTSLVYRKASRCFAMVFVADC